MSRCPAVSVVIPTFNRAALVTQAIESVFAQSFRDYEIIVVDDGSSDSTRQRLESLVDSRRIRYAFQARRGEAAARNHGIRLARGEYIAFLDSDDLLMPHTLEKQVASLEHAREVGLVHGGYSKFDERGQDLGYRDTSHLSGWVYPEILLEWSVLMAVPTVMVRACVLAEVEGFDESMNLAADLDLWRRIAMRYPFVALAEMLARVRQHPGSSSRDRTQAPAAFETYLKKAFQEDPALRKSLRRRATARMYANVGNSLLGEGEREHMTLVRCYCLRSIAYWPFQLRALVGVFGSFGSSELRSWAVTRWRRHRFRTYVQ